MKKSIAIYVFFLALTLSAALLITGCGEKGPADVAKDMAKEAEAAFGGYTGGISVVSEEIFDGGNRAKVELESDDGSITWTFDMVKEDGKWVTEEVD